MRKRAREPEDDRSNVQRVTPALARLRILFVNVYFAGDSAERGAPWVLVDAGLPHSAARIVEAAEARFGRGSRPAAIVLTHGHFDHVGALETLVKRWNVPVYAHALELPYLTGASDYAPPDPSVDGGAMARLSFLYPRRPINLGAGTAAACRRSGAGDARLALDLHAGTRAGARLPLPRGGPHPHRRGRLRHRQAGIGDSCYSACFYSAYHHVPHLSSKPSKGS